MEAAGEGRGSSRTHDDMLNADTMQPGPRIGAMVPEGWSAPGFT
ncbi:hypothetical protein [Streptomyces sp. NPDC001914]